MLACLYLSVSASVTIRNAIRKKWRPQEIAPCSDRSVTFRSYGRIHSAYTDHVRIFIVRTYVPFPPCPEILNMLSVPDSPTRPIKNAKRG